MSIHVGIEDLLIKEKDPFRKATGDVAIAEDLSDHGPILALGQGVVVGLP